MPGCVGTGAAERATTCPRQVAAAETSYPIQEVRGGSRDKLLHARAPRAVNEKSYHRLEVRRRPRGRHPHVQEVVATRAPEGQEELLHIQGQGGVAACLRPLSKVRSSKLLGWSSLEEIPHVQSKKNSK